MRFILLSILFSISSLAFTQNDTTNKSYLSDTFYYKYEAIFIGPVYSGGDNSSMYYYNYFRDSVDILRDDTATFKQSKATFGICIKTHYFSFTFTVKPITDLLLSRSGGSVRFSTGIKRSLRFSYYFNKFQFKTDFEKRTGWLYDKNKSTAIYDDDTLLPDYQTSRLLIGGEYYFNKNFSFSKSNSLLYFPKKSFFSFAIMSNFFSYHTFNNGNAFLPTVSHLPNGQKLVNWSHLNESNYFGLEVLPGAHCFLVRRRLEEYSDNHQTIWYLYGSVNYGPNFYYGKITSTNMKYDASEYRITYFNFFYNLKYGINFPWVIIDIQTSLEHKYFILDNFKQRSARLTFNFSLMFPIPFKKGYEKTDKFMKKINPFKRKKVESNLE